MNALQTAIDKANKAAADAATLGAIAPHLPGEPTQMFVHSFYGSRVSVSYKIRTIAELNELLQALPPVPCVKYRGTFAGVKPADQYKEKDGAYEECDGMTLRVRAGHCIGAYPCDQHPMKAEWYAQAGADRVYVSVEFHYNAREDWPSIRIQYETARSNARNKCGEEYETKDIAAIYLMAQPPHSERMQFASGDRKIPGEFLVWFRDPESRALSLECLE